MSIIYKDKRKDAEKQEKSKQLEKQLVDLPRPLLIKLNEKLDRGPVKTLLRMVMVIAIHRHRNNGLLLSELGSYQLGAETGRAGTKRISTLVQSKKWKAEMIKKHFWQAGTQRVKKFSPIVLQ